MPLPTQDIEGYESVTKALTTLLNQYPELSSGDKIQFDTLDTNNGKAFFADNGAFVMRTHSDVTGHVEKECQYPFYIIYRTATTTAANREKAQRWLDELGHWLEHTTYPELTNNRKIKSIERTSIARSVTIEGNAAENWLLNLRVLYTHSYQKGATN